MFKDASVSLLILCKTKKLPFSFSFLERFFTEAVDDPQSSLAKILNHSVEKLTEVVSLYDSWTLAWLCMRFFLAVRSTSVAVCTLNIYNLYCKYNTGQHCYFYWLAKFSIMSACAHGKKNTFLKN